MTAAWVGFLIVALLLPGVAFFLGFWARERYSREVIKSSAVGDVGSAIFFALAIHLAFWAIFSFLFGFNLSFSLRPLADDTLPMWLALDLGLARLWFALWYLLGSTVLGFFAGMATGWLVMSGPLRGLATHKWIFDILKLRGSKGVVTVYVMTTTVENNKALMYKGHLEEFYLDGDGRFTYVVLKNAFRYFMSFEHEIPMTSKQKSLFQPSPLKRQWDYLMIDGSNIANILFDPSGDIIETDAGTRKLDTAIERLGGGSAKQPTLGPQPSRR
jgi:hypothetical protein